MALRCLRWVGIGALLLPFALFAMLGVHASPITMRGKASPLTNFASISSYKVLSPSRGTEISLGQVISGDYNDHMLQKRNKAQNGHVILFLTHLADLASFELAQQVIYYLPQLSNQNTLLTAISPGASIANAEKFCSLTNFPINHLLIDSSADLYRRYLPFNRGFLADQGGISAYLKLLPMLMGIGSPGTIQEVLRGYVGDKTAPSNWIRESLRLVDSSRFNVVNEEGQRPFELATMRLQNMRDVLTHWRDLVPTDEKLLTQLGGAFVFQPSGTEPQVVFEHIDTGILTYVNLQRALRSLDVTLID